ncbi:hypothetical protein OV079_52580 [Nannocystis pusilla]|uniref:Uncharacterized protein n=1 Tax=Nannocystis pusilla TaxID=889268 RepID=A0A9X3J5E9_9BACT|nr:hypothetical protein [Nannocystis pusilla]MCY1014023.1 hypothetical protein [Nannocystis pusilla]
MSALSGDSDDVLRLLPDDGAGGFVLRGLGPTPDRVTHDLLAVGDVDVDARPDIAAASAGDAVREDMLE